MSKKNEEKKPTELRSRLYTVKDGEAQRPKSCPMCGTGVFLAKHKDRLSCGKCGYTEWSSEEE